MKVYRCKFVYPNELIKVGDKFVIWDGNIVPYKSSNGLGMDKNLAVPFDKFFEEDGEIKASEIPFLKKVVDTLEFEVKSHKSLLKSAEKELKKVKDFIRKG